ncbi:carbohydrate kinase family protein [Ureibacillus sp. MALMAid1270]|uniref:carbohydrate kinase family protein n=1 Tax=Ureibacillus sp. MALMAid1270 TaxID=3411629 RepID=UPI003BA55A22
MRESILCVGELLIDFFCNEINVDLKEGSIFIKKAGGAPANVCAAVAKLGGKARFLGKVGNDPFGLFLESTLNSIGVCTDLLLKDNHAPTTLAFVSLQEDGQRDFVFNRGADANLTMDEIPLAALTSVNIVHFGSATALLTQPFQQTYKNLMAYAKNHNHYITFDPNYRTDLWGDNVELFKKHVFDCIPYCDFIKVSEEELYVLTNEPTIGKAVLILHSFGVESIAVTLGKVGTFFSLKGQTTIVPSISIQAIDSTGAGDAFVGATLYQLDKLENPKLLTIMDWTDIIQFSNKVGAIACEKIGAIESLPTLDEVLSR